MSFLKQYVAPFISGLIVAVALISIWWTWQIRLTAIDAENKATYLYNLIQPQVQQQQAAAKK